MDELLEEPQDEKMKEERKKNISRRFIGADYSRWWTRTQVGRNNFSSFILHISSLVFDTIIPMTTEQSAFSVQKLDFYYGKSKALSGINLEIEPQKVTALIGPSGCGKSTFLRCLNRMNDTIHGTRVDGTILLKGENIYDEKMDVVNLRQRVGMVFQKPNPFPQSIYDNVAFGPRVMGMDVNMDEVVKSSLERAHYGMKSKMI